MTKEGEYTINNLYQGGYSSLSPSYGDSFIGYHTSSSKLGAPTKPDTANQIQQVDQLLKQGIVPIEVGTLQPEVFDQIPKTHFKEINRMAKLSGAKISVHAPLIEPSGMGEQGWSESNRQLAERQLGEVIDKSIEMDDKGGMPITIHSAGIPGTEYKMTPEGKKIERLIVVEQETGKPAPIQEEIRHYPELENLEKPEILDPLRELNALNSTKWRNSISTALFNKDNADKILDETYPLIKNEYINLKLGKITPEQLTPQQHDIIARAENAGEYLRHTEMNLHSLFDQAYKYGTERDKEILKEISKQYKDILGIKEGKYQDPIKAVDPKNQSRALQLLISGLGSVTPKLYVPIEDFAIKHSSETFANVAFNAFKKHKDKTPVISIENLYPGIAFSTGKEMDKLITESKNKFVEKAIKEGYSRSLAEEKADKLIGMTLDVGHLNIARKRGFETKDLLKEVQEISKHVKHVHLTDNFGYSDSHLPPGMGNVPTKEILEELERAGVKDVRKIVEAGGFVQHFGISPFPATLESLGSPIYSEGPSPYWNQILGLYQGYLSGSGQMLPSQNYQMWGSGFSMATLPTELGGQMPGAAGSRMSGNPME